jgi:hypothetical protein
MKQHPQYPGEWRGGTEVGAPTAADAGPPGCGDPRETCEEVADGPGPTPPRQGDPAGPEGARHIPFI